MFRRLLCLVGIHEWRVLPCRTFKRKIRLAGLPEFEEEVTKRLRFCVHCPRQESYEEFPFSNKGWVQVTDFYRLR